MREMKKLRFEKFFGLYIIKIKKQVINFNIKILEKNLSFDLKSSIDPEWTHVKIKGNIPEYLMLVIKILVFIYRKYYRFKNLTLNSSRSGFNNKG